MPRLVDHIMEAYPERNDNNGKFFRMGCIFFMIFIFRNIFLKDYRSEEINVLRKSGLSQENIDTLVPPSSSERLSVKKKTKSEYEQMRLDVAVLKEEMKIMKEKVGLADKDDDETGDIEVVNVEVVKDVVTNGSTEKDK